jgi:hypothetical protein
MLSIPDSFWSNSQATVSFPLEIVLLRFSEVFEFFGR